MPRFPLNPRKHASRVQQKLRRGRPRFIVRDCHYDPCALVMDRESGRALDAVSWKQRAWANRVAAVLEHQRRTGSAEALATLVADVEASGQDAAAAIRVATAVAAYDTAHDTAVAAQVATPCLG